MNEQALQINFKHHRSDRKDLHALLERMADALPPDIGELDGYELATDFSHGRIFLYGPDASRILQTLHPLLRESEALDTVTAILNPGPQQTIVEVSLQDACAAKPAPMAGTAQAPKQVPPRRAGTTRKRELVGLLVGIPRDDGRLVLGQVAEAWGRNVVRIVIYDFVFEAGKLPAVDPTALTPIFNELTTFYTFAKWAVFSDAHVPPRLQTPPEHEGRGLIGLSIYNDVIVEGVVNAFYGLKPWRPLRGIEGGARLLLIPEARLRSG